MITLVRSALTFLLGPLLSPTLTKYQHAKNGPGADVPGRAEYLESHIITSYPLARYFSLAHSPSHRLDRSTLGRATARTPTRSALCIPAHWISHKPSRSFAGETDPSLGPARSLTRSMFLS